MKRFKESGALYRRKKKLREEERKKSEGSLHKHFDTTVVDTVTSDSRSFDVTKNEETCLVEEGTNDETLMTHNVKLQAECTSSDLIVVL